MNKLTFIDSIFSVFNCLNTLIWIFLFNFYCFYNLMRLVCYLLKLWLSLLCKVFMNLIIFCLIHDCLLLEWIQFFWFLMFCLNRLEFHIKWVTNILDSVLIFAIVILFYRNNGLYLLIFKGPFGFVNFLQGLRYLRLGFIYLNWLCLILLLFFKLFWQYWVRCID